MIATKAIRVVHAAKGKAVIEFGLRREPGIDAGMKVARSSYIAGCQGTSNVLAGMTYGIPVFGTMAHSFIMSYPKEIDAFRAFAKTFPDKSTLLIDTYDDIAGAEKAVIVAKELEAKGYHAWRRPIRQRRFGGNQQKNPKNPRRPRLELR